MLLLITDEENFSTELQFLNITNENTSYLQRTIHLLFPLYKFLSP